MFEIKNVSKQYNGEFALKNISLTIGKGMNFIVGASGSGKTTLLKIISGMEHDFDGEVFYYGKVSKRCQTRKKDISIIIFLVLSGRIFICWRNGRYLRILCCLVI